MKLSFSGLKANFAKFLLKQGESNTLNPLEDSLFLFSSELKDFLKSEYNLNLSEMNLTFDELLSADFSGGEFDFGDQTADLENETFDKYEFLQGCLNEFISNDEIKTMIDSDGDKDLSKQEVMNFFEQIKGADGNDDDISFKDLFLTFSGAVKEEKPEETQPTEQNNVSNNSGSYNNNNNVNNNSDSGNDSGQENPGDYSTKSTEELQKLSEQNNSDLSAKSEALKNAISGNTDKIKTAKTNYDSAKSTYLEALNGDESLAELKDKSIQNTNSIEAVEGEMSALQLQQSENDSAISGKENEISGYDADLSELNSSKSALSSKKSDDPEKQKEISDKLAKVEAEIKRITELKTHAEAELKTLNDTKTQLEQDLTSKEGELSELQSAKKDIDNAILSNKNVSEDTKTALRDFNSSKTELDKTKTEAITQAQTDYESSKVEAKKVNEVLNEKQAKEKSKEYSVNTGEFYSDSDYEFEEVHNPNGFDYVLIKPKDLDETQEVPVITWLHGWQDGNFDRIKNTSMYDLLKNHPEEMGGTFNGIIVMPLSPDSKWKAEVNDIKNVVREVGKTYNIDKDNIVVAGHSEGSLGVLACAGDNDDHFFSRALTCSASFVNGSIMDKINIPVYGVGGNGDMDKNTKNVIGSIKKRGQDGQYFHVNTGHAGVPRCAFRDLKDSDGVPKVFKLLFPDYFG
ncbi:prolyl oligopeptidase family serine peptidase [bacterium]|nr:prolyl oligopeptidase family serine peptidase [bacterium]